MNPYDAMGFWIARKHNGAYMGFVDEIGVILTLFTTRDKCEKWIMDAKMEQHIADGPYDGPGTYNIFCRAEEEFDYYTIDPDAQQKVPVKVAPITKTLAQIEEMTT